MLKRYLKKRFTNTKANSGTYVTSRITGKAPKIIKYEAGLTYSFSGRLPPINPARYSMGAHGGVMFPRDRFVTEMAAKWTGSIPTDVAIGKRRAAERIFPETSSTSMPIKRRIIFSISRTSHLLVVNSNIKLVSCWGT